MNHIDDIILKSLTQSANEEELSRLEEWIKASGYNDNLYQEILRSWHLNVKKDSKSISRIWSKSSAKINPERNIIIPVSITSSRSFFRQNRLLLVAAIALLISLTGMFLYVEMYSVVKYQTTYGQKKEFKLPDETHVVLNANSHLWYNKNHPRKVWLDGEACFSVKKKPETGEKFTVVTTDLEVEVLGTIFNVNSQNDQTRVYLKEGSVKLHLQGEKQEQVDLVPGDFLSYSLEKGKQVKKKQVPPSRYTSWKDGAVILESVSVSDVLDRMSQIYGIEIRVLNESMLQREVTIAIPIENLEIALEVLESVLGKQILQQKPKEYLINY